MINLSELLIYAIAAFVMLTTLHDGIMGGNLQKSLVILRRIRPLMIIQNTVVLVFVVTVSVMLNSIPVLGWGWWQLLDSSTEAGGQNAIMASTSIPIVGTIFLVVLFFAMPRLAEYEEELFRKGTTNWKNGVKRSILFGLVHCFMGVSIGVGLALSICGLWFTHQYFKGGVKRSTSYHAAWNLAIVSLVIITVIID